MREKLGKEDNWMGKEKTSAPGQPCDVWVGVLEGFFSGSSEVCCCSPTPPLGLRLSQRWHGGDANGFNYLLCASSNTQAPLVSLAWKMPLWALSFKILSLSQFPEVGGVCLWPPARNICMALPLRHHTASLGPPLPYILLLWWNTQNVPVTILALFQVLFAAIKDILGWGSGPPIPSMLLSPPPSSLPYALDTPSSHLVWNPRVGL